MLHDDMVETGGAEFPTSIKTIRREVQRNARKKKDGTRPKRPLSPETARARHLERCLRRDTIPHVATRIVAVAHDVEKMALARKADDRFDDHSQLVNFLAKEHVVTKNRPGEAIASHVERTLISAAIVFCELEGYMNVVIENGKRRMHVLIDDLTAARCGCSTRTHSAGLLAA